MTRAKIAICASCLLPVAGLGVAALPGCFILGSPGPSAVGQGHQYKSGDPDFDDFFENLFNLQVEMANATDEEKQARRTLAKKLDVDPDASASLLAKKAGTIAKDMADKGVGLKMKVDEGDEDTKPDAELTAAGGLPSSDDKEFISAVEKAVQKELDIAHAMDKHRKACDRLQATIVELEPKIDATFRLGGPHKKAEVRKNLDDAKKLIPLMSSRADDVHDAALGAAKKIAEAVQTDDGRFSHPAPPPETGETKPEETPGHHKPATHAPAKHAPASHAGAPAPAPAPAKPKPKPASSSSDFEP